MLSGNSLSFGVMESIIAKIGKKEFSSTSFPFIAFFIPGIILAMSFTPPIFLICPI